MKPSHCYLLTLIALFTALPATAQNITFHSDGTARIACKCPAGTSRCSTLAAKWYDYYGVIATHSGGTVDLSQWCYNKREPSACCEVDQDLLPQYYSGKVVDLCENQKTPQGESPRCP